STAVAPLGADHHHGDRVGWLLLMPVIALLLAPPPALGSFSVDRTAPGVSISSGGRTAVAAVVRIIDSGHPPPARDSWVTVVGTFRGVGPDGVPELDAANAYPRQAPIDPYE